MKGKVAPTKSTAKAYVLFCLSPSAVVSPALYRFFIDSETKKTIPLHFRNVFHFFSEKNSLSETFLVECVRSGAEEEELGVELNLEHTAVQSRRNCERVK